MTRTAQLVDDSHRTVAVANVGCDAGLYSGAVDLGPMPSEMRRVFERFEEIVNGQMFSVLDQIQDEVERLGLMVVFDGTKEQVEDLQIFPSDNVLSFRLAAPVPNADLAPGFPVKS